MRLDLKTDNAEHQNKFNFELITKKNAMKNIDVQSRICPVRSTNDSVIIYRKTVAKYRLQSNFTSIV